MRLIVIEEYGDFSVSDGVTCLTKMILISAVRQPVGLGTQFSIDSVEVIYNATTSA